MKFYRLWILFLVCSVTAPLGGCNKGDVKKAAGEYRTVVVNPSGKFSTGSTVVTNSGNFFSIVITSDTGSFAFAGPISGDQVKVTFTDSLGKTATAIINFSTDRSTFDGSIQTSTGLFVVQGTRISA